MRRSRADGRAYCGGRRYRNHCRWGTRGAAKRIVEIASPERAPFNEIVARYLKAVGDPRLGRIGLDGWFRRSQVPPDPASEVRQESRPLARAGPGRRTKEATMTIKLVALVLLCLVTGTAMARSCLKIFRSVPVEKLW